MKKLFRKLCGNVGRGFRLFSFRPETKIPDLHVQHSDADALRSDREKIDEDLLWAALRHSKDEKI